MQSEPTTNMEIVDLPLSKLHADEEFNSRGRISLMDVTDLSRSMQESGLQQPINVSPYNDEERAKTGKDYLIICGYRRFHAARVLEWPTIPCVVQKRLSHLDALLLNLSENLHRKNLNILQEAKAISNLKAAGLTQEDVARYLQQSRGWVQVRFLLLDLPNEIQIEAAAGLISQQQIRDLSSIASKEDQFEAVRAIKDAKLKGEKSPKVHHKTIKAGRSVMTRRERTRTEIFEMIEHIAENIGYNIGTRTLAWAAGEIADVELYRDIKNLADEKGIAYEMPSQAMPALS